MKHILSLLSLSLSLLAPAPAPADQAAAAPAAAGQAAAAPVAAQPAVKNVVIFIFEGVEALDFAGPFGVFSSASDLGDAPAFRVHLATEKPGPVRAQGGMLLQPDCVLDDCPKPDVLVISGGPGVMAALGRPELLTALRRNAERSDVVLSVCVGAFLLAKAGLLDGATATTHKQGIGFLRQLAPKATVVEGKRFVDNGKIVTSAGMSAGIDASLHLVSRLLGAERATAAAAWMEYDWKPQS